jgi:hypothetical protein
MKPVKNYSKGGRKNKGVNLINVYYMHVWKYHNEPPFYNEYTLIKKREKTKKIEAGHVLKIIFSLHIQVVFLVDYSTFS